MKAFINTDIYTSERVFSDHALVVQNGRVKKIIQLSEIQSEIELIDLEGKSIAPGFIDLQVNGGAGILFNTNFSEKDVKSAIRAHQKTGATSIFPTVFTSSLEAMEGLFETVTSLRGQGFLGASGIHYEGPVINPDKAGVHNTSNILPMNQELVEFYKQSAKELPTLVTVAPEEVSTGAVGELRKAGVLVLAGHTNATYKIMQKAMDAGVQGATHLYNAMSGLSSREPGVVGSVLSSSGAYASIILDGHHLHWASFQVAHRVMEPGKLFFVTDSMPCVGSETDEFMLGSLQVFVRDGRCVTKDGTLAGSALTMSRAVKNAIQKAGVPRREALLMASTYPARFAGLKGLGDLEAGSRADFIVFSNEVDVTDVYISGVKL